MMSATTSFSAAPYFAAWNMSEWNASTSESIQHTQDDDLDVQLMLRVKDGDIKAFEMLVERHQRSVINMVMRMINHVDDAHDISQQVFVRVWRSASRYEAQAKFTTWLFTITRNLVFNEIRRRGRKNEISIDAAKDQYQLEPTTAKDQQPDTHYEQAELENAVRVAIASLPEKQRIALCLRRYEDMAYEDICEVLDMSLSAVKSLLFRARNELKEKLAAYLHEKPKSET